VKIRRSRLPEKSWPYEPNIGGRGPGEELQITSSAYPHDRFTGRSCPSNFVPNRRAEVHELGQTVRIRSIAKKTVAFLQSRIGVKFCQGVDIVGGHVPLNFLSILRPFGPTPALPTCRKKLAI
jgi:hypothetical protein